MSLADVQDEVALTPLTASLGLITAIRAVIGIAAFVGLRAAYGSDEGLDLAFAVGLGIVVLGALLQARTSRHFVARERAELPPPNATRNAWWRIAVRAAWPSTIGLAVLIAIAGPLAPFLAAGLAGAELGLGGMSLVFGIENGYWERRAGVVVEYQSGLAPRFFARPR
jgi:hypothetical protein